VQGRQQHTFHDAEDPGVHPNAEGQGEHSYDREPWIPAQLPQSVAKIMHESTHFVFSTAPAHPEIDFGGSTLAAPCGQEAGGERLMPAL
jgi:hypothetical protein